jgi:hypothetical protein
VIPLLEKASFGAKCQQAQDIKTQDKLVCDIGNEYPNFQQAQIKGHCFE